jgi:thiosulfate reductase cytochrome b subunit
VKGGLSKWLPGIFLLVAALSRWPGLMPPNFSAVYALIFCSASLFPSTWGWKVSFGFLVLSDLALNAWYQWGLGIQVFSGPGFLYLAGNYVAFGAVYLLGRMFRGDRSLSRLVGGGVLGAILFYLVTNSLSWLLNPFHNPEYTRTLAGWIQALTKGAGDWPGTWQFFKNSLLSSALFTALFGWGGLYASAESPAEKGEVPEESEPEEAGA